MGLGGELGLEIVEDGGGFVVEEGNFGEGVGGHAGGGKDGDGIGVGNDFPGFGVDEVVAGMEVGGGAGGEGGALHGEDLAGFANEYGFIFPMGHAEVATGIDGCLDACGSGEGEGAVDGPAFGDSAEVEVERFMEENGVSGEVDVPPSGLGIGGGGERGKQVGLLENGGDGGIEESAGAGGELEGESEDLVEFGGDGAGGEVCVLVEEGEFAIRVVEAHEVLGALDERLHVDAEIEELVLGVGGGGEGEFDEGAEGGE